MKISEVIEYDVDCVREYCNQLLAFAESPPKDFTPTKSKREADLPFQPISISHLVRSDLLCNIYSLLDYRLKSLCQYHEKISKPEKSFEKFKQGDKSRTSDLDRYRRYFQTIVGIDLKPRLSEFRHLDLVRRIRNVYIHDGGHADDGMLALVANISGVTCHGSLLVVKDEYIYETLDHASAYLQTIAKANSAVQGRYVIKPHSIHGLER